MSLIDQCVLYIGNLPSYSNEKDKEVLKKEIFQLFSPYGQVDDFKIIESKNYGFLNFHSEHSVDLVLEDKRKGDFILFEKQLKIERTKRKQPFLKKKPTQHQAKSRLDKAYGNRKERKNLSSQFLFSCFKEYEKSNSITFVKFRSKVDSREVLLPDLEIWTSTEPAPTIFWNNVKNEFQFIISDMKEVETSGNCENRTSSAACFEVNQETEQPDSVEISSYEPPKKLTKVLFQKDYSDKIEQLEKHYKSRVNVAYILAQMAIRQPDMVNYPIEAVKGLQLETRGRKKTLWVLVSFEGDWPKEEKEMWCSHLDVAASELMERYMEEEGLDWELHFKGYKKREKKCHVDESSGENCSDTEIFKLFKEHLAKLKKPF